MGLFQAEQMGRRYAEGGGNAGAIFKDVLWIVGARKTAIQAGIGAGGNAALAGKEAMRDKAAVLAGQVGGGDAV